ncbi:MAG: transposase [Syntrophomonadaceae bacterium]|jgi:putative transposase|nr:transposase [Syntrophomonadaceae bacterium]
MPRHRRMLSETGMYHVIMRGNERKNLFLDGKDKQKFLDILYVKKQESDFQVYAFCLMDNHIHLLLKESSEGLATMMKRINVSFAYYFNQKHQRIGHLFQDRFKSEPIENERYLLAVIRYIHNNPVKAGIVKKPEQYKWSSYNSYLSLQEPGTKLVDTDFVLSILSDEQSAAIRQFQKLSREQDENEFLDVDDKRGWTIEEGRLYLEECLAKRWPGKNLEDLMKIKGIRREIILDLKTNTRLSGRGIARLLSINRGIVQKTKVTTDH